jgi:glycosyltransferase involved in cell wall biosynthesis
MKTVLLITTIPLFPAPGIGGVRVIKFAKFLPEYGWQPIILTVPAEDTPADEVLLSTPVYQVGYPNLSSLFTLARRLLPKRRKTDAGSPPGTSTTGPAATYDAFQARSEKLTQWFLLPDEVVTWVPFAVRRGRRINRRHQINAIVSSSPAPSTHLAAMALSRLLAVPWVADFRDPWVASSFLAAPTSFHRRFHATLERQVVTHANRVVTVSPVLRDDFATAYPHLPAEKFGLVRNGFDPDDFDFPAASPARDTIRIVHSGKFFYYGKDPFPFLKAIKLLRESGRLSGVTVHFVGVPVAHMQPIIAEMELDEVVTLTDFVPYRQSLRSVMAADILLLVPGRTRGMMTAKVYEYLAARKPILALTPPDSTVADFLRHLNLAQTVDPDSPTAIAAALRRLIEQTRAGSLPQPDEAFIDQFTRRYQTGQLADYLAEASAAAELRAKE